MHKTTLRDVATASGVSVSTVSKIVSGHAERTRLRPATIKRVLAAVQTLRYVPNQTARSLRTQCAGQIGLTLAGPFHPDLAFMHWREGALLTGLSLAARQHRLPALVIFPQIGDEPEGDPAPYMDGRIDGLLARCVTRSEHRLLEAIDPARLPVVAIWSRNVPDGMGYVDVDHYHGAVAAVEHLLALGHQRIVFADTEERDTNPHFAWRYQGYRDALKAAGVSEHLECAATDIDQLIAWIEGPKPCTAVFVPQDLCAAAVIERLRARSVRVPADISVVGFDGYEHASRSVGGLTTVQQPLYDMMMHGVENLLALIGGASAARCRTVLPASLIVRNTTSPPRVLARSPMLASPVHCGNQEERR